MTAKPTYRPKAHALEALFGRRKAVIGMIHCRPLPGAPAYEGESMDSLVAFAVEEAARLKAGGIDGLIVENHGDIPFVKPDQLGPETATAMAVITDAVRRSSGLVVGVNVLANGAIQALAVAKAAGARFVRVNQWANAYVANEGLLDGPAGVATRYRSSLRAQDVRVFADVHVKHGAHAITGDRSIPELARDVEFFDADVTIATGQRTGDAATLDEIRLIAEGCGLPVVVGSGVNPDNVGDIFSVADGVIVASYLKRDGVWWNEVDPDRLRHFMSEANPRPGMSRVFVLGNAMVDLTLPLGRLPLPGETVVADDLFRAPGGKGLNQAVVAARAGGEVWFRAAVGRDADAALVRASLEAENLASLQLSDCDAPTDLSIVMVAADGENSIVSLCQAADIMTIDAAVSFVELMHPEDWLLVQGNLSLEVTAAAAATARSRGGCILFNAAPLRWPITTMLRNTDLLVVNRVEATALSGHEDPAAAAGFLKAGGAGLVVVTLGQAGCLWLDTAMHYRSAAAVQAVDTTGAGDSFCGALVAALAGHVDFDGAIGRAQSAASISVMRRGAFAALPSTAELRASQTSI